MPSFTKSSTEDEVTHHELRQVTPSLFDPDHQQGFEIGRLHIVAVTNKTSRMVRPQQYADIYPMLSVRLSIDERSHYTTELNRASSIVTKLIEGTSRPDSSLWETVRPTWSERKAQTEYTKALQSWKDKLKELTEHIDDDETTYEGITVRVLSKDEWERLLETYKQSPTLATGSADDSQI